MHAPPPCLVPPPTQQTQKRQAMQSLSGGNSPAQPQPVASSGTFLGHLWDMSITKSMQGLLPLMLPCPAHPRRIQPQGGLSARHASQP